MRDKMRSLAVLLVFAISAFITPAFSKDGPIMDMDEILMNGTNLFEGDIVLTAEQWQAIMERNAVVNPNSLWSDGPDGFPLVFYLFTTGLPDKTTAAITVGINHWMEHTCVKFEETSITNQQHLRFMDGGGCWSYIGRLSSNGQNISIAPDCTGLGTVAHEIAHAMGVYHEQSRTDRDEYVVVVAENIKANFEGNFNKYGEDRITAHGVNYDYSSIMHYGSRFFTKNDGLTLITKDPLAQGIIGQRGAFSHRDKLLFNRMYGCIDKWLAICNVTVDPCQNEGYFGKDCHCICPPGTSGDNCETDTGSYYAHFDNECTEIVTEEGTLTSPNYPNRYTSGNCTKFIQAPECHFPKLTFNDFSMYMRIPLCENKMCCYLDRLEIRLNGIISPGNVYCDTDFSKGDVITSTTQVMILFWKTRTHDIYTGFSANLTFVPEEGCNTTEPTTQSPTTTSKVTTTTATATTPPPTTTSKLTSTTATSITSLQTTTSTVATTATNLTPTTIITSTSATTCPLPISTTLPTTTTSPTPTTTSPAPKSECSIELINRRYYWSSPDFGTENYPDNALCKISGSGMGLMVTIRVVFFNLQREVKKECVDFVEFTLLYGRTITFCGQKRGLLLRSPSFNFIGKFISDSELTNQGYNISIEAERTACHKIIDVSPGVSGIITPPIRNRFCEYIIKAPLGYQVRVIYLTTRITRSKICNDYFVVLNGRSENMYPEATSLMFCGLTIVTNPMTTETNELYVAYHGRGRHTFRLRYVVI